MEQNIMDKRLTQVRLAILKYVDAIYLTMYSNRAEYKKKSVSHIASAINSSVSEASSMVAVYELNDIELRVFNQLRRLLAVVRTNQLRDRIVYDTSMIESLLSREDVPVNDLIKYIKLVMALCRQFDYSDINIVLPRFVITSADTKGNNSYLRSLNPTHYGVNAVMTNLTSQTAHLWDNIFKVLVIPGTGNRKAEVTQIFSIINIPVLPDAVSGIGLTKFTFDSYLASNIVKRFTSLMGGVILGVDTITRSLRINNRGILDYTDSGNNDIDQSTTKYMGSYEAAGDDAGDTADDTGGDDTGGDDTGGDDTGGDDTGGDDAGGDDTADDTADDTGGDDTGGDDTGGDDTSGNDAGGDDAGGDSDNQDNPDANADGDDNTHEPKTEYLGLNLELPKDETLDDLMYKISIASQIDNIVKSNHEEVTIETITALMKWKNMYLFLVSAAETKRFLENLKIK